MRRYISAEMWTRLNRSYLRLRELGIQEIWRPSPESFYADTAAQIDTFAGVAAATMYHDAGWRFMRLGRSIERAQLATALLLAHLAVERTGDDQHEDDWISLLRCGYAREAYHRRCSVAVEPERVLDLLVTDALLPGSLCHALDGAAVELAALGPGPHADSSAAVQRSAKRLTSHYEWPDGEDREELLLAGLIHSEWPDGEDREELLLQVDEHCRNLHQLVADTYFDYPVAGLSGR